jgi:hypothetical protein
VTVRPATREDIEQFYPDITASFRAWVVEVDGVAKGIIGLALTRPYACLFSSADKSLNLKSIKILKLIKKVEMLFKVRGLPVLAVAEPDLLTAPKILTRLGFEHFGDVDGDDIYIWWGA